MTGTRIGRSRSGGLGFIATDTGAAAGGPVGAAAGLAIDLSILAAKPLMHALSAAFGARTPENNVFVAFQQNPNIDTARKALSLAQGERQIALEKLPIQVQAAMWPKGVQLPAYITASRDYNPRETPRPDPFVQSFDPLIRQLSNFIMLAERAQESTPAAPSVVPQTVAPAASGPAPAADTGAGTAAIAPQGLPQTLAPAQGLSQPAAPIVGTPAIGYPANSFPTGGTMDEFNTTQAGNSTWPSVIEDIWGKVAPLVTGRPQQPPPPQQQFSDMMAGIPWWVYVLGGIAVYSLLKDNRGR